MELLTSTTPGQAIRHAAAQAGRTGTPEHPDNYDELQAKIAEYNGSGIPGPAAEDHLRGAGGDRGVRRRRRTKILPGFDGDMSVEDLIPEEEVVITITHDGYVKRTLDNYRRRAAAARASAASCAGRCGSTLLRHHHPPLAAVLHQLGPGLPDRLQANGGRPGRQGQHVANVMAFLPDETIAQVLAIRDYEQASYRCWLRVTVCEEDRADPLRHPAYRRGDRHQPA